MLDDTPHTFGDTLGAEYRTLRPGAGFDGRDEATLIASMHAQQQPLSALCISGGGIRSATFALGAIQGLAARGLLTTFDYVSTVSGGGYIGGFLTAWAHRAQGMAAVQERLRPDAPLPPPGGLDPIHHLREYNSYMSPRTGLFSNDVWTILASYVRNILLNWLVLIPFLMAALMVPRIYLAVLSTPERLYPQILDVSPIAWSNPVLDAVSGHTVVFPLLALLSGGLFATALFFTLLSLPNVGGRATTRTEFSVRIGVPLVLAVLTFLMFDSLYYVGSHYTVETKAVPAMAWVTASSAAAWLLLVVVRRNRNPSGEPLLTSPVPLAGFAMAAGTGLSAWMLTNTVLRNDQGPVDAIAWAGGYVTAGPPALLLGYALGTVLFVGLTSRWLKDEDREWMARGLGAILMVAVAWAGLCTMVLLVPRWALGWRTWAHGLLAVATGASAWLSTRGGIPPDAAAQPSGALSHLQSLASRLAAPAFLGLLAGALSVLTNMIVVAIGTHLPPAITALGLSPLGSLDVDGVGGLSARAIHWTDHDAVLTRSPLWLLVLVAGAFAAISAAAARFVNINTFSLHGMYRDRLIRAYLGASNAARQSNPFTGFAADDNLKLAALATRPLQVLNFALNLVDGSRLDWQQRKAESFTASPLHCGSRALGYRPSASYAGGMSLGTAIAISGAAASPNAGYHSSPAVGAILTLFNARMGCWLGNPGARGALTWRHQSPRRMVRAIVDELLGRTSDSGEYVYLSDGGHFENLAVYEMVRRRCRTIVVLDGDCDPDYAYDDLGDALRKVRIDMGIAIEFDEGGIAALRARRRRCAVGTIRYSAVDGAGTDGRILYLKPLVLGTEEPDVLSYAKANPAFPHESTSNQWFNEAQTESYRSLGLQTVTDMCHGWTGSTLEELYGHVKDVYLVDRTS